MPFDIVDSRSIVVLRRSRSRASADWKDPLETGKERERERLGNWRTRLRTHIARSGMLIAVQQTERCCQAKRERERERERERVAERSERCGEEHNEQCTRNKYEEPYEQQ